MDKIWAVEARYYFEDSHWVEEYYKSEDKAFEKLEELRLADKDDVYHYRVTGPHTVK